MAINFFSEDTSFLIANKESSIVWIEKVIQAENSKAENINYIFCSDKHLQDINKKYLSHDSLTDIITFNHSEKDGELEADIYISIERVKGNAAQLNKEFIDELDRVMIHGVLHLLGFNDKTAVEVKEMRKKEDACLSLR